MIGNCINGTVPFAQQRAPAARPPALRRISGWLEISDAPSELGITTGGVPSTL